MSRIGRKPVELPKGVTLTQSAGGIEVKGPKGTLRCDVPSGTKVAIDGTEVTVSREGDDKPTRAKHGLVRALVANMVRGVTEGFARELEIHGVGYRANVQGKALNLTLGFSHPVKMDVPAGLTVSVQENRIRIEGADRALVGQFASDVRELRPPEPYKGKGIRYVEERVRRKVGKAGA